MKSEHSSGVRVINCYLPQAMREQAVEPVCEDESATSVATAFGVSVRSVYRWPVPPGRPPKVGQKEMRWLADAIRDHSPLHYKLELGLWTLPLVAELIQRQFGKKLSLASVSRIMTLLGLSAQKPLYQAWQRDAALVRQWRCDSYPTIRVQARAVGARIYFVDESGIPSDSLPGATWAPCGQASVAEVTGQRIPLNMVSAVGPRGDFRFMVHEGPATATVFRDFLKRLRIGADKPIFVILDGHAVHKTRLVKTYVESQSGQLKLFHLPSYS